MGELFPGVTSQLCSERPVLAWLEGGPRSKDGDWVVGTTLGNNKKGVHLRSQDQDRSEYIHECPCQVTTGSTSTTLHFVWWKVWLVDTPLLTGKVT